MNRRDAVLTIPTAIAAVALKLKANPAPTGQRDIVRQVELRRVISLWDEAELLAADIRRRLEEGAKFEPGEQGVATWGHDAVTGIGGSAYLSLGGIDIGPANHHRQVRSRHRGLAAEILA
jgi:hypothetical protein